MASKNMRGSDLGAGMGLAAASTMAVASAPGRAHPATPAQEDARWQASQRLAELIAVREVLLPDAEDAAVLSELTSIEEEMKRCAKRIRSFD
jgi:hypothetical protein